MKRLLFLAALLAGVCSCADSTLPVHDVSPLVAVLLEKIDSADVFMARKEEGLAKKRAELAVIPVDSREYYDALITIAYNYSKHIADSSIAYYDRAMLCARKMGDRGLEYSALFGKVAVLNATGFYVESHELLESLDKTQLDENARARYYISYKDLYHGVYQGLASKPDLRAEYVRKFEAYRDTVLMLMPASSGQAMKETERMYARKGRFQDAIAINNKRLSMVPGERDQDRAIVLYDRFILYHYYMGRPIEDHLDCLLQSVIIDVTCANQDIASLRYAESYLASIGDLDGAKKLSDFYYATMMKLGSRARLIVGMDMTMKINEEYAVLLSRQKHLIQSALMVIILLSLVLLFILWLELRSRHKIVELNKNLEISGKTSKSYVLGFFQLYSSYISRLQALRSKINTNTRKGNTKFVLDLTDPSKDFSNEELKQMYHNFDNAFLSIYPNFVRDFNALLKPECHIALKPNELLNTELRIFAAIKLGITDSAKISEVLHYSIKTVYNKRSEINGKLLIQKEKFYEELAKI